MVKPRWKRLQKNVFLFPWVGLCLTYQASAHDLGQIGTLQGLDLIKNTSSEVDLRLVKKASVIDLGQIGTLKGLDLIKNTSSEVDLRQAKKASVIVFLSAKCPCSASHESVLGKLNEQFKDSGFSFIGIHSNSDEPLEFASDHFKKSEINFPVLHDPQAKWADALAAFKTPHVFVLSPKMEILFNGGVDSSHQASQAKNHYLRDALFALRDGKEPTEKNVRVLGCAIRRPS